MRFNLKWLPLLIYSDDIECMYYTDSYRTIHPCNVLFVLNSVDTPYIERPPCIDIALSSRTYYGATQGIEQEDTTDGMENKNHPRTQNTSRR